MNKKYLKQLIDGIQKDILNNTIQLWIYQREAANPQFIGKQQAEEGVAVYEKRIAYLKDNLAAYLLYKKENNL